MRIHALEATGGLTYAQMGRFMAKPGRAEGAVRRRQAQRAIRSTRSIDSATKQPVDNGARNLWVTETALTTALNTSYMAEQLALFGIVVGVRPAAQRHRLRDPRHRRRAAGSEAAVATLDKREPVIGRPAIQA